MSIESLTEEIADVFVAAGLMEDGTVTVSEIDTSDARPPDEPRALPPVDYASAYAVIDHMELEVGERELKWNSLKEQTKLAKDAFDLAVDDLRRAVRKYRPGQAPLFEQDFTTATEEVVLDDAWQSLPVTEIPLDGKMHSRLIDAGMKDVGAVADWMMARYEPKVKGFGPNTNSRETLEGGMEKFWESHPQGKPETRDKAEAAKILREATAELTEVRNQTVDRLLHDAEHAESGAAFAKSIGHHPQAEEMTVKAKILRQEAEKLDPKHEAPAWAEDATWARGLSPMTAKEKKPVPTPPGPLTETVTLESLKLAPGSVAAAAHTDLLTRLQTGQTPEVRVVTVDGDDFLVTLPPAGVPTGDEVDEVFALRPLHDVPKNPPTDPDKPYLGQIVTVGGTRRMIGADVLLVRDGDVVAAE